MTPGVTIRKKGTDFVVRSRSNRLWLMLFDRPEADTPVREIEMESGPDGLWHTTIPDAGDGTLYLYRTDAVPEQWLLDLYARAVHTPRLWGDPGDLRPGQQIRTGRPFPKSVVCNKRFSWADERRPRIPLEKTVIYETHLRGFSAREGGGTYLDFISKIPYLKELGVTAVEFLPIFEFNELEFFLEGGTRRHLLNFWGYSTVGFFAPMSRYASSTEPGAAVTEFKTLVNALHKAGIEVILDVVFNHTAEGAFDGPNYSFRALDEDAWYLIRHDGSYANWTGCGNTVNANHPHTAQFIVDCLKYWVNEMHVDGFRFDLATCLCRDADGTLLEKPPVIEQIEADPDLKHTKLIAEAWDLGAYQVGTFPGRRFSDWNGRYRDDVRCFWNEDAAAGELATRLAGSSDLYEHKHRGPLHSINFITSHDGFTLADLVTYERKHNEANGEHNRDGEDLNHSIHFGAEGPTDDPAILARRLQQQKNLLATLFLSRGVPMLTAGDEFGRTQQGNNNAYCQDNEISWIDWALLEKNRELFEFTKTLIALRKKHPVLHNGTFYTGNGDIEWMGPDGNEPDWNHGRALGMLLPGRKDLLILINNEIHTVNFKCSPHWKEELSTAPCNGLTLPPHSLAVFSR